MTSEDREIGVKQEARAMVRVRWALGGLVAWMLAFAISFTGYPWMHLFGGIGGLVTVVSSVAAFVAAPSGSPIRINASILVVLGLIFALLGLWLGSFALMYTLQPGDAILQ